MLYFQLLRHAWSDEWNFVYYYRAKDIPSFLDAWGEMVSRASSIVALRPFFTESLNSAAVPTWISYRATGAGELVSGATSVPG